MRSSLATKRWSRLSLLLLAPGCFVSFNDYPLGAGGSSPGGSENASGGKASPSGGQAPSSGGAATSDGAGAGGEVVTLPTDTLLIDDFEDGNQHIMAQAGRSGSWYVSNDGRGNQTPRAGGPMLPGLIEPLRGNSTRGLHTFGGPFAEWGALIGTSLASMSSVGVPYDLRGYTGITIWVRAGVGQSSGPGPGGGGSGVATQVRLNLPTPDTNEGGSCSVCNDHFGFDVPLTQQWEQVRLPFSDLAQVGFGEPELAAPDLEHVTALQLAFPAGERFDLWVDDIALFY